jgi:tRNA pseudouridine55 synthase
MPRFPATASSVAATRMPMPADDRAADGILLLDKPAGLSSNAALQRVRNLLGRPKAGHTGSLDPLATGMLPICIGEATKVAGVLLEGAKGYTVTARLGARTDSGDSTGSIVEEAPVPALDASMLERVLATLRGPQQQVPPMYSALKHQGQPLYKLARRGVEIERAPRAVEIYRLEAVDTGPESVTLRVECSKGTYVRTLVEEFGRRLGSLAHVTALRREFVEPFRGQPMHTLEELQRQPGPMPLLPADSALPQLPPVHLAPAAERALQFGQSVPGSGLAPGIVRLYAADGRFMGLGEATAAGCLKVKRLFAPATGPAVTGCSA